MSRLSHVPLGYIAPPPYAIWVGSWPRPCHHALHAGGCDVHSCVFISERWRIITTSDGGTEYTAVASLRHKIHVNPK